MAAPLESAAASWNRPLRFFLANAEESAPTSKGIGRTYCPNAAAPLIAFFIAHCPIWPGADTGSICITATRCRIAYVRTARTTPTHQGKSVTKAKSTSAPDSLRRRAISSPLMRVARSLWALVSDVQLYRIGNLHRVITEAIKAGRALESLGQMKTGIHHGRGVPDDGGLR